MEPAGSGDCGSQRFVVTEAERAGGRPVADRGRPGTRSRDRSGGAVLVSHLRAESRRGHLHAGCRARPPLPRGDAARRFCRDARARRRYVRWLLRVPRRAPRGRAGAGGRQRAVPAVDRFPLGSQAGGRGGISREPSLAGLGGRVSADGRVRARRSRRAFRPRVLLRHSSSGGEPAGAVARAAWTDGQRRDGADRDLRAWPGAAGRCRDSGLPAGGGVRARRVRVLGGSGTPASSGLPGSRASRRSGRSTACRLPATRGSSGDWSPDRPRSASSRLLHILVADS